MGHFTYFPSLPLFLSHFSYIPLLPSLPYFPLPPLLPSPSLTSSPSFPSTPHQMIPKLVWEVGSILMPSLLLLRLDRTSSSLECVFLFSFFIPPFCLQERIHGQRLNCSFDSCNSCLLPSIECVFLLLFFNSS